jgi:hypothetical protein
MSEYFCLFVCVYEREREWEKDRKYGLVLHVEQCLLSINSSIFQSINQFIINLSSSFTQQYRIHTVPGIFVMTKRSDRFPFQQSCIA